ncbi:unnamed protein product [Meganyctiphanes norvegica]|uniref:G-protein coupled receptors family 1 profile domain-containing protein n=1 Tax=Meganyctiphanes norvegica TaxID=48144 RepID=A0AAV2QDG7_MEGNR
MSVIQRCLLVSSICMLSCIKTLEEPIEQPSHAALRNRILVSPPPWIFLRAYSTTFTCCFKEKEKEKKSIQDSNYECIYLQNNNIVNKPTSCFNTELRSCYHIFVTRFSKFINQPAEHPASLHMKRRVLRMLVYLTLLVIFLWVPNQAFEIARWYLVDEYCTFLDPNTKKAYNILMTISKYLMFVTPAVNPIVYALMHQNFRRAYRTTFTCCFKEKSKFFLTSGGGNRPYIWSIRTSVSAFASSVRRKSMSMRGRSQLDIPCPSASIQDSNYGNTLTVPGQDQHIDININHEANCSTSENVQQQKINNDENTLNSNGTDHKVNGHIKTEHIPLE